jgi:hypothetical protein
MTISIEDAIRLGGQNTTGGPGTAQLETTNYSWCGGQGTMLKERKPRL